MSAEASTAFMPLPPTVVLEQFRYKAATILGPQVRDSLEVKTDLDRMMDRMLCELHAEVYGKRGLECRKQVVATYPATWWDALKRDLRRRTNNRLVHRWLDRHPIRIDAKAVTLDFSERMLFPDNTVAIKGFGDPHFIQRIEAGIEDWGTDD